MDDDDHYGPNHLTDLITAHTYSNADITGKLASIVHISEFDLTVSRFIMNPEQYHWHVAGPTMTGSRKTMSRLKFLRRRSRVDTTLLERLKADNGTLYITHPQGFILARHDAGHTWEVDDYSYFLNQAIEVESGVSRRVMEAG
jgi:hypothetical protein